MKSWLSLVLTVTDAVRDLYRTRTFQHGLDIVDKQHVNNTTVFDKAVAVRLKAHKNI